MKYSGRNPISRALNQQQGQIDRFKVSRRTGVRTSFTTQGVRVVPGEAPPGARKVEPATEVIPRWG